MKWYWKVRLSRQDGPYAICEIVTPCGDLTSIRTIIDFYEKLTLGQAIIERMSEQASTINSPSEVFTMLYGPLP